MSGSASLTLEQGILQHTLGIAAMAFPAQVYVALCAAGLPPSESVGGVEAFGGSYARVRTTFALLASPTNIAANTASVEFPLATADWGELGYFEIWSAQTGGSRLYWGGLVDPVSGNATTLDVSAGDIVRFSAGTLAVEVAAPTTVVAPGVSSFNTRTGAVILSNSDVVAVLPPSANAPLMDGVAAVGTSAMWARGDHVHPTSGAPLDSPVFTGNPTAPTPTAGDNDTSIATTAFVQAAVAPYAHNVGRNLLHNPLFNIAQRGVGPFTTSGYTVDRWLVAQSLDTVSFQQMQTNDAARAGIGDEQADWVLVNTFTGNAGAGASNMVRQPIENVRRLAGKTVTISFWAWATSGTPKLGVSIGQGFGTGGLPSAAVSGNGTSITTSTTQARYSVTLIVPSISGKTLGTNNNSATYLNIWFSSGATNNALAGGIGVQSAQIALWGVQLEIGSVATPLEKPDPRYDLSNCQRFYQVIPTSFLLPVNPSTAGWTAGWTVGLNTAMRANPSVVFTGTTLTNATGLVLGNPPSATSVNIAANAVATSGGFGVVTTINASADL